MENKPGILIVDDHIIFRECLCKTLKDKYKIIGNASGLEDARAIYNNNTPDVAILDISLENESGFEFLEEVKNDKSNQMKIVILSMHNKPLIIKKAIDSGADSFVLKHSPTETLIKAIETVLAGKKYLDPLISDKLMELINDTYSTKDFSKYNTLSEREQEIFRHLAEGDSTGVIAHQLFISKKTVENHRVNIHTKLGTSSTSDIVKYALKIGLITI